MNEDKINIDDLRDYLDQNAAMLLEFDISTLSLFGSIFKGNYTENSDIDLLIEFLPGKKNYKNFFNACLFLESLFNRKVELITPESLKSYMKEKIIKESEIVFKRSRYS